MCDEIQVDFFFGKTVPQGAILSQIHEDLIEQVKQFFLTFTNSAIVVMSCRVIEQSFVPSSTLVSVAFGSRTT